MTDSTEPSRFSDVNEAVGEEWEAEITPYERVHNVISHTHTAVAAETVADKARTTPKTARKHLSTLADEGFVATEPGANGGTRYRRSPESLVVEQSADILEELTVDELVSCIASMRETLTDFQDEYGAESPEEVAVDQTNRALSTTGTGESELGSDALQEWQTTVGISRSPTLRCRLPTQNGSSVGEPQNRTIMTDCKSVFSSCYKQR